MQNATLERKKGEQKNLEAELEAYDEYLYSAKQNRHDLRHHNNILLQYLSEGDVAGAKAYLVDCEERLETTTLKEYCKNKTANAVFRVYSTRCDKDDIVFSVCADLANNIAIPPSELSAVLANLLENAWHACLACHCAERFISVSITTEEGAMHLEIRNTTDDKVQFRGDLPLSQRKGGGIGPQSVQHIAHRHGGIIRFAQQANIFFVHAVLPFL